MIGQNLGNYKIIQKIGAGGQGTVYKATDQKLGRTVVVKVLPAELTVKEANLKRFEREARLASSLDHPNICTIFDMDEANGLHFIAMQYVEGRNVRQLVNGRPLELESTLRIAIQVADALAVAHARGIIHRDIKSGNIMVTDAGQVKILDFGLAKLLDESEAATSGIHQTELTEIGVPYGTATYAAPEQARGETVTAASDIFSLGCVLYEMVSGHRAFPQAAPASTLAAILNDDPRPVTDYVENVPAELDRWIGHCLRKDEKARPQSARDLGLVLRDLLAEPTAHGRAGAEFESLAVLPFFTSASSRMQNISLTAPPRPLSTNSPNSRS